jgi:hypothetical protein
MVAQRRIARTANAAQSRAALSAVAKAKATALAKGKASAKPKPRKIGKKTTAAASIPPISAQSYINMF